MAEQIRSPILSGLRVKTSDGQLFTVEGVSDSCTVVELKERCVAQSGVAGVHQKLFLKGKQLQDSDTLAAAGVVSRSMLFLTKTLSWGKAKETAPEGMVPCAGGCGSFGTLRCDNFCPECFEKMPKGAREALWRGILVEDVSDSKSDCTQDTPAPADLVVGAPVQIRGLSNAKALNGRSGWIVRCFDSTCRFVVKLRGEEGTKSVRAANLRRLANVRALPASLVLKQHNKTRCWHCSKKCGLTGFRCRCGYVYCSTHRHAEDHYCDFDHQELGKEILARSCPKAPSVHPELLKFC